MQSELEMYSSHGRKSLTEQGFTSLKSRGLN